MDLGPVVMLRVQNVRSCDGYVLVDAWYCYVVGVALTSGDRVLLSYW